MARQMKSNIKKFNLEDAPIVQENEQILESGKTGAQMAEEDATKRAAAQVSEVPPIAPELPMPPVDPVPPTPAAPNRANTKKTQNGITIYVPMDYYMQILRIKMETGVPIKDIAQQAVIEYLDRHKND